MSVITILAERDETPSQVGQAMRDAEAALMHLIELRSDPATRDDMGKEEAELWRLKSHIEFILTSIQGDHVATTTRRRVHRVQAAE